MSEYSFQANYKGKSGTIKVNLLLIHFQDERNIHLIYSPHLDITGYGETLRDAKESFKIVFDDFIDYTLKKGTLIKVMINLGWQVKGTKKRPKNVLAPKLSSVIGKNVYVSEIFDNYKTQTYHKEVGIPAHV